MDLGPGRFEMGGVAFEWRAGFSRHDALAPTLKARVTVASWAEACNGAQASLVCRDRGPCFLRGKSEKPT